MQRERWHGTLEALVASPAALLALILLPITLAMSTIGIYCLVATLLFGRFVFGIDLTVEHQVAFGLSIVGDRPLVRRARLPVRRLVRPLPRRLGARAISSSIRSG